MGLRKSPWKSTPAVASAIPTSAPPITLGSLIWKIIVSSAAVQLVGKSKMAILLSVILKISGMEMDTAPKALAMNRAAIRQTPSSDKTRAILLRRFNL